MSRNLEAWTLATISLLTGCGQAPDDPVQRLEGTEDASAFELKSLNGTRDGERFDVRALYGDGSRLLTVQLHLNVTPPPKLTSGTWTGFAGQGEVRERSLTFLGGQSGGPSIGGRFDLIGPENRPLYRITIPLQELRQPL